MIGVKQLVALDRIIDKVTPAFNLDLSPYPINSFDEKVKNYCFSLRSDRLACNDVRLSKVIILGDMAVGKTSLISRFVHNCFSKDYKSTIGVDFEVERFQILSIPFNLQMWDTAGQERFKCIAAAYYRGANAIVVAFDLTDRETLYHAEHWLLDAISVTKESNRPFVFLVGTKNDLIENIGLDKEFENEIQEYTKRMNAEFWKVSSLTGENVKQFFFRLSTLLFNQCILNECKNDEPKRKIISVDKEFLKLDTNDKTNNASQKPDMKCC